MRTTPRPVWLPVVLLSVVAGLAAGVPAPAAAPPRGAALAAPGDPANPGDEGESPLIRDVLAAAGREYAEAKAKLAKSTKRQVQLGLELRAAEQRLAELTTEVSAIAAQAYRTGRLTPMTSMMGAVTADQFVERLEAMELLAIRDDRQLRELKAAREQAAQAKAAIDAEAKEQQRQLAIIDKRKEDAERALREVGGESTGGYVTVSSPVAKAAPRNPDGSWPSQSCSVEDPTTSGCITPRTLNALKEAQKAGFTRFVSCYRSGGPYEHPKGRACDFSAERGGFGGHATGGDKTYGNNLAAFFVRNANRLGVLYVIWYRQIWFPATGWRSYSNGGDPSSAHTNHVHLSLL